MISNSNSLNAFFFPTFLALSLFNAFVCFGLIAQLVFPTLSLGIKLRFVFVAPRLLFLGFATGVIKSHLHFLSVLGFFRSLRLLWLHLSRFYFGFYRSQMRVMNPDDRMIHPQLVLHRTSSPCPFVFFFPPIAPPYKP